VLSCDRENNHKRIKIKLRSAIKGKTMRFTLIILFLSIFASPIALANTFSVNGLQTSAWLERDGQRQALKVATELKAEDKIITGGKGKVWLTMPDGAIVKLGNNAQMRVKSIFVEANPASSGNTVNAGLDILEGAFRYTTSKLESYLNQNWQRNINIKMAESASIGIRGTDLWGQVGKDNQFVVLLEGQISVTATATTTPLILDQPLQIYKIEDKNQLPISTVDMAAVQQLAPETELDFGKGVMQVGSSNLINLASFTNQNRAQRLTSRLNEQGYPVEIQSVDIDGEQWYRVLVNHLVSYNDARSLMENLEDGLDVSSPWLQ
jgi:hypothetical protein